MSLRLLFVVESGTDVRLVEGLSERAQLHLLARRIRGGREISQPTQARFDAEIGPAGLLPFAGFVLRRIWSLRSRIDVVIVQGYGLAAAAANLAGRLAGLPVVMLVCSPVEAYYRCRRFPDSGRPYRAVEYAALSALAGLNARIGQRYVALSPYLASVIRAHGTGRPIDVIPVYGVDTAAFTPPTEAREALRARLGLPSGVPLLFFSSRIAPEKDAGTLLEAVRLLRERGRRVCLVHLSGSYRAFVQRAEAHGVAPLVHAGDALPPDASLADVYRAVDLCVQASREEGLGFSVLEALACGVPVVATAVGGLRDTIRDGDTGWTVPPGDPAALADVIGAVLDSPDEAAARAARGRALVAREYERSLVFERLWRLLDSLLPVPYGAAALRPRP